MKETANQPERSASVRWLEPNGRDQEGYFQWVLTGGWVYVVALAASFIVATVASPAGVSGAVLLLPF